MRVIWAGLLVLALCGWLLIRSALSQMWLEEVQTRLGRLPHILIRLATSQIPAEHRDACADEWAAELTFVLRDTEGLPITRLFRATSFAAGLLRAARSVGRELSQEAGQAAASSEELAVINEAAIVPAHIGYPIPTACAAAGITLRQLDYWARTGLVEPSVRPTSGSGSQRLYGLRDILVLNVVKRLLDTGISLQHVRAAIAVLRDWGTEDLAKVTLMSDGLTIYDFTSPEEVYDLLQAGHGVFAIALGRIWQEVEGKLASLPTEPAGWV